ncbi:MAG: 1,4-alpha-glucan branching protein GlgB [bacterium]|nr:1,4-alpha-glucan branching protein GlgB [bacterium]
MDFYGFYTGKEFQAYEYLGAHVEGKETVFRTFAPNAREIWVIGEFNDWQGTPMQKVYDGNFWECRIEGAKEGMMYKYRIHGANGRILDHCDPYGFGMELRPHSASLIRRLDKRQWKDAAWMEKRSVCKDKPLNIYELHMGSWKKKTEAEDGWYSYTEMAKLLVPYLKENHYQYIEVLPLSEHPMDASWGYQNTGFFSPTSRYGTAEQLQEFVDYLHRNEIGVILDFVPVHFAVDDYALWQYDGTALYEYPHVDVGVSEWGSCNFMHSRGEVRSFLQSAAYYWLEKYHMDGLRMDAVSNLIYWQGDVRRGENKGALQFLQTMNVGLKEAFPTAILAAEDSSAYVGVTKAVSEGGLGFDYKWDMGWMNDTLDYCKKNRREREQVYHQLTFSMQYFYQENYILPLSHDEVVHGKASIFQKMNGDYEGKFPQAKTLYLYMFTHPGKKLNFMGNEFAQVREWDEKREQDWMLFAYPNHENFYNFMKKLHQVYEKTPALYEKDYDREGFVWVDCAQTKPCVYVYERRSDYQRVLVLLNFSDETQTFAVNPEDKKGLKLLIATDEEKFGGERTYRRKLSSKAGALEVELGAFSAQCYEVLE